MTLKSYVRTMLLASLVMMALGGFLLHLRIHSFTQNTSFLVNFIAGILSVILVPLLFLSRKTIHYGYILNGFIAVVGTITMAHFTLAHLPEGPLTFGKIILKTTLADILIVWGKFFIGKALFDLETVGYSSTLEKTGRTYRYPNLGWWLIHFLVILVVYSAGKLLWR